MFNKLYLGVGAATCLWFATGTLMGWKGWGPPAGGSGSSYYGSSYGGHRGISFGGWGGGK